MNKYKTQLSIDESSFVRETCHDNYYRGDITMYKKDHLTLVVVFTG